MNNYQERALNFCNYIRTLYNDEKKKIDFIISQTYIKKEYSFLRNIFDEDDLKKSKSICNLETYYDKMQLFLHLIKVSEIELRSAPFLTKYLTIY